MFWDQHMHTYFSTDSNTNPRDMIVSAINKGLPGICFTDHYDFDYPDETPQFQLDTDAYWKEMLLLQDEFAAKIPIHIGIELGLQTHIVTRNNEITTEHPYDFVIGSSHVIHGIDPYFPEFYEGKTEREAYLEYFESILENLATSVDFDVYGHLDYIVRYGPNRNEFYSYESYREIIDEILKTIIEKGKGIELNTGGFKYKLGHPNPTEAVLKRYRELGGEILTIGADAHAPEHVGYDFHKVEAILKEAGFSYYTVFKNRKPIFHKI